MCISTYFYTSQPGPSHGKAHLDLDVLDYEEEENTENPKTMSAKARGAHKIAPPQECVRVKYKEMIGDEDAFGKFLKQEPPIPFLYLEFIILEPESFDEKLREFEVWQDPILKRIQIPLPPMGQDEIRYIIIAIDIIEHTSANDLENHPWTAEFMAKMKAKDGIDLFYTAHILPALISGTLDASTISAISECNCLMESKMFETFFDGKPIEWAVPKSTDQIGAEIGARSKNARERMLKKKNAALKKLKARQITTPTQFPQKTMENTSPLMPYAMDFLLKCRNADEFHT